MSRLFERWSLGALELENRIVVAPMCQYSAQEGSATDWHQLHLGSMALSGAGLMILEATAISPQGRITPFDLGLYNDANEAALKKILATLRGPTPIRIAIQLAHAGRKGSCRPPWDGGSQIRPDEPLGWRTLGPSAAAHAEGDVPPLALDKAGLATIREGFAAAAKRAARLGLDGIELHAAHGYLLHEFLSPVANHREDEYGGSLDNRMRFPLEVFDAVREAAPSAMPVWMRVSATDWVPGGWDLEETVALAKALERRGAAAIHVSTGGVSPRQTVKPSPGYQVPFAKRIKREVGVPVIAVGLITEAEHAEAIIANGEADAVALARTILFDPRWPWHAAARLGARIAAPKPYWRSPPREYPDLFEIAGNAQR